MSTSSGFRSKRGRGRGIRRRVEHAAANIEAVGEGYDIGAAIEVDLREPHHVALENLDRHRRYLIPRIVKGHAVLGHHRLQHGSDQRDHLFQGSGHSFFISSNPSIP